MMQNLYKKSNIDYLKMIGHLISLKKKIQCEVIN